MPYESIRLLPVATQSDNTGGVPDTVHRVTPALRLYWFEMKTYWSKKSKPLAQAMAEPELAQPVSAGDAPKKEHTEIVSV